MQLALIREWERLCPDLRHVAFSSKFHWTKSTSSSANSDAREWDAVETRDSIWDSTDADQ